MSYYKCPADNLRQEADRRRGFSTDYVHKDKLIEHLKQDDNARGSDATTVKMAAPETDPDQKELSSELGNQSKHTTACAGRWCKKADKRSQKSYIGP